MPSIPSPPATALYPCFHGQGRIGFEERAVPLPGPGELLLRVRANALCGSERGQFECGSGVTPGHEAAGEVAVAGPGTQTPVGTRGVVFLMGICGTCANCAAGWTNQCMNKHADMGFNRDGGYGPYELVQERIFFPVPPHIEAADATLLLDIMGTGGHAIRRGMLVRQDVDTVLVTGAGPIGLGVAAMARALLGDAVRVFATDVRPYRLELAAKLGAIPIDARRRRIDDALRAGGRGRASLAIDTTGRSSARRDCLDALDQRGVLVCVGHGEGLDLTVSPDLIAPERAVLGSEYFRWDELPGSLDLYQRHAPYFGQIITHRFPVTDIQHAFELFFAGDTGKVVITQ